MTRNGGRRALQDRRLAELSNSKLTAKARDPNQNTTFSNVRDFPVPVRR